MWIPDCLFHSQLMEGDLCLHMRLEFHIATEGQPFLVTGSKWTQIPHQVSAIFTCIMEVCNRATMRLSGHAGHSTLRSHPRFQQHIQVCTSYHHKAMPYTLQPMAGLTTHTVTPAGRPTCYKSVCSVHLSITVAPAKLLGSSLVRSWTTVTRSTSVLFTTAATCFGN